MRCEITLPAYAKLNLFLEITARRPDGYHDIQSIMQRIDLHDLVTITKTEEAAGLSVLCDSSDVPAGEKNSAYKAARLFFSHTGIVSGASVQIEKKIPLGGGLGGSSADAAAVLLGLNKLFGTALSVDTLCALGAQIGADVPFCIRGGLCLCEGIGELLTPLKPMHQPVFLILKPDFALLSGNAYAFYDNLPQKPTQKSMQPMLSAIKHGDWKAVTEGLYNVFQTVYQDVRIEALCAALLQNGALSSAMTGSGSCVFGVFDSVKNAEYAASRLAISTKFICHSIE